MSRIEPAGINARRGAPRNVGGQRVTDNECFFGFETVDMRRYKIKIFL